MEKQKLLEELLKRISRLKKKYLKKANTYRRLKTASDVVIIGSSTVATTTLILSFSIVASPLLIVSLISSSVSTFGSAMHRAVMISVKAEQFKNAYLSFYDLEREIKLTITKNLNKRELDLAIADISDRIGLIVSTVPVISLTDSSKSPDSCERHLKN